MTGGSQSEGERDDRPGGPDGAGRGRHFAVHGQDSHADFGFLGGGGAVGALIRSKNRAETPLGPPENWPQSLRTTVSTCLNCSFPILIWWGPELVKIYNDAYAGIIAQKHPWALGRPARQVWPEIWATIGPMLHAVLERGEAAPAEDMQFWLERRGFREECYFSFSYSPIRDETGRIVGVFCPVVETTQRVFAERRANFLLALEGALRNAADADYVKYTASRMLGEHLGVAQVGYAEILPGGERAVVEKDWSNGSLPGAAGVLTVADFGLDIAAYVRAGETLKVINTETDPRLSEPAIKTAYLSRGIRANMAVPLLKGGILRAVFFVHHNEPRGWTDQDVAFVREAAERTWSAVERARAEVALRRSEDEFRTLSDNLPTLCWMADSSGAIYWFNRRCCEFSGKTQQELIDGAWQDLHDPANFPEVMERWSQSVTSGAPFEMVFPLRGADGVMHPFLTRVVPLADEDGAITKWFGTNVDITEQRGIEERLRESESKLLLLNESLEQIVAERTADRDRMWRLSTDIMLVARLDGTINAVNPAWTKLLGWRADESIGRSFLSFVHPDDVEPTLGAIEGLAAGNTIQSFGNRYRMREGGYRWFSWTGVPDELFIHAVGRDVTAEKEAAAQLETAQERLRQAQRMEALGQLAGGIAHDFNNVLQAVSGGLSLIRRRADDANAVRQLADMAESAANRGAAVTSRLLAFARKDQLFAVTVPPGELLEGLREILAHTLGSVVRVRTEWDPSTPPLLADKAQLETVLVNLAVNARDAMPEGGLITISATSETVETGNPSGLEPGDYIRIDVADTGAGMDAVTRARAGEPFFTTKPLGQGTGLGLAMAGGFARQSGGGLGIRSAPGKGTTVSLWFPQAGTEENASAAERGNTDAQAGTRATNILLVDDEPLVRDVLSAHLEEAGFRVTRATDGLDALARLDSGEIPGLLVSDYAMPGMNGLVLLREAKKRVPGLPVLLLTGYADRLLQAGLDDTREKSTAMLRKPVSADELVLQVGMLLENARQVVV